MARHLPLLLLAFLLAGAAAAADPAGEAGYEALLRYNAERIAEALGDE